MASSPQDRKRRIRRNVGAASLAAFAVAWGVIAGTGAMGHTTSSGATAAQSSQSAQSSGDDGWGFSSDDGGSTAQQSQQSQQQLPQMTTRQS